MKNFKFLALAALFGMSINANAAITFVSGEKTTVNNIQYTVTHCFKTPANANQRNTVSVKANNFTGTALTIPGTIELDIEVTADDAGANAYTGKATFIVTEIENDGFKATIVEYLTSVDTPKTIKEMQSEIADLSGLSNQRMSFQWL